MKRGQDKPGTRQMWDRRYLDGGLPHYQDRKAELIDALARHAWIRAAPVLGRTRQATRMQEDLERMEKEGIVKRELSLRSRGVPGRGAPTTHRVWVLVNPPEPKVVEVREPYKKRKAAIAELEKVNK